MNVSSNSADAEQVTGYMEMPPQPKFPDYMSEVPQSSKDGNTAKDENELNLSSRDQNSFEFQRSE